MKIEIEEIVQINTLPTTTDEWRKAKLERIDFINNFCSEVNSKIEDMNNIMNNRYNEKETIDLLKKLKKTLNSFLMIEQNPSKLVGKETYKIVEYRKTGNNGYYAHVRLYFINDKYYDYKIEAICSYETYPYITDNLKNNLFNDAVWHYEQREHQKYNYYNKQPFKKRDTK